MTSKHKVYQEYVQQLNEKIEELKNKNISLELMLLAGVDNSMKSHITALETALDTSHSVYDRLLKDYMKLKDGWIPVSEKLPLDWERVLICRGENRVSIGIHNSKIPQWATDDGLYYHTDSYEYVTSWQPLPKQPKEQK